MIKGNPILKPSMSVAARIIGEQAYLLDPSVGQLERLNPVGSFIWSLIEKGNLHLDEIHRSIVDTYEVKEEIARADLNQFLEVLVAKRMVDFIN